MRLDCTFPGNLAFAFLAGSHNTGHAQSKKRKNAHTNTFLGPMALFTHLKIILLQCFQQ